MANYQFKKIEVDKETPYLNDLLGREHEGLILQELVETFGGFVMALNGKWGSGKTTFVSMWQQQMKNEGYTTIYYNSWENDYISDPLISLIAEFKKTIEIPGVKPLKKFVNAFRKVSEAMVPSFLALAAKKLTGLDLKELEKAIEKGAEEAIDIIDNSVDNYIEQQKSIKSFRDALTDFVGLLSPQKPVIFIIDELDRCKPDFAVKTLERIKHLFSVKNVVFVLSIDREQLGHSIRGYYGSDLIDSDDYLRRFIDVQFDMHMGDIGNLLLKAFKRFDFHKSIPIKKVEDKYRIDKLGYLFLRIYENKNLSIRQLEKWMIHTRLVINQLNNENISIETITFLVYLHDFDYKTYNNLVHYNLTDQEIFDYFMDIFPYSSIYTDSFDDVSQILAEIYKIKYYQNTTLFHEKIMNKEGQILLKIEKDISGKFIKALEKADSSLPLLGLDGLFRDLKYVSC